MTSRKIFLNILLAKGRSLRIQFFFFGGLRQFWRNFSTIYFEGLSFAICSPWNLPVHYIKVPNNQVKFNVAIISNVHIYQLFFFWGGGKGGGRGGLVFLFQLPWLSQLIITHVLCLFLKLLWFMETELIFLFFIFHLFILTLHSN